MSDLDHVSLNVSNYERSKAFYQAALEPLGIKLIMEGQSGAGFGRSFPHFSSANAPTSWGSPSPKQSDDGWALRTRATC